MTQQILTLTTWIQDGLRFSHYRDKDQNEVDLVVEGGNKHWSIEVKRSALVNTNDARGLARLSVQAGRRFQGGMLLHGRTTTFPLDNAPNSFAVSLSQLWN